MDNDELKKQENPTIPKYKDTNTTEGCTWRFMKILMGAVVLWTCLSLTNPTFDDYRQHVQQKMTSGNYSIFSLVGSYILSEAASDIVVRYDYKIFSVYELTGPSGEKYNTFGILKMLFEF